MATAARIEANRLNAQKSTRRRTVQGKVRARLNAIKHGMTARTIMPVLPNEDPKQLEDLTQQAITDMQPRNVLERGLVCQAAWLSWEIERAARVGTAHLAHRVRMAARSRTDTVSARELKKVHDLGRRLFLSSAQGSNYAVGLRGDDEPAVIVRRLEESAEGCRWLLERWAELLNILDRKASWTDPEMLRFIGLQGKHSMEAVFDPKLNSIFLAFNALGRRFGQEYWESLRDKIPASEHE
ncbi:MAG TPA: hypothetical protein VKF17_09095 [Isosphaeraceae bacterium]|nr:hypothetical protein [Isosphaeraceae bacterium]